MACFLRSIVLKGLIRGCSFVEIFYYLQHFQMLYYSYPWKIAFLNLEIRFHLLLFLP